MKRLNFTLNDETIRLLERLADTYYDGNKSQTVRAALESLASHIGHDGWIIAGYSPIELAHDADCHTCGTRYGEGQILFRPVFERGRSTSALPHIPDQIWLDCSECVEHQTS